MNKKFKVRSLYFATLGAIAFSAVGTVTAQTVIQPAQPVHNCADIKYRRQFT